MPNNRNPFFRVYVGDELRLLKNLSTDAYGVYCIFRNWAHDADPYAHLIDAHGVPLSDAALVDLSGLRASAFRAAFQDLCSLRAVWSARAWLAQVQVAEHAGYVEVARELCVGVRCLSVVGGSEGPLGDEAAQHEPLLLPALADQYVRQIYGKRTGRRKKGVEVAAETGGGTSGGTLGGTLRPPPTSPLGSHVRGDVRGDPQAHSHDNDNDNAFKLLTLPVLTPVQKERNSPQRAREADPEDRPPMSWSAYRTHCMRVAHWQKGVDAKYPDGVSEERLAALYEAEFHETWEAWRWMKGRMERSVPEPCRDGHHVFDGSSFCRYCPYIRAGEDA